MAIFKGVLNNFYKTQDLLGVRNILKKSRSPDAGLCSCVAVKGLFSLLGGNEHDIPLDQEPLENRHIIIVYSMHKLCPTANPNSLVGLSQGENLLLSGSKTSLPPPPPMMGA